MEYVFLPLALIFIVFGIFAIVVAAKQNKRKKEFAEKLTPEQKQRLAAANCE